MKYQIKHMKTEMLHEEKCFIYVRNSENIDGQIWICNDKNVRGARNWDKRNAYILFYVKMNNDINTAEDDSSSLDGSFFDDS